MAYLPGESIGGPGLVDFTFSFQVMIPAPRTISMTPAQRMGETYSCRGNLAARAVRTKPTAKAHGSANGLTTEMGPKDRI